MRISAVLLDACNLQLDFELLNSAPPRPIVTSIQCHDLPGRLATLTQSVLPSLDAAGVQQAAVATAVYDGAAYHGNFYDGVWDAVMDGCAKIHFTSQYESADDRLMRMIEAITASTPSAAPPKTLTATEAIDVLEKGDTPRPVIVATRQRAVPGKADRERRENFLKSCGLPRLGDSSHLIAFNEMQRGRSLNLVRGLKKLGPGIITFRQLEEPALMLVTDDRGLRRYDMVGTGSDGGSQSVVSLLTRTTHPARVSHHCRSP